ncbi:mitochondrial 37S ribosomal protein rsm10 [Gonapodya sp. JEL0774]|nr:mitochondrial 37S ribosomal protein rsm10 [Gonapodya sp. JEL0774]
MSQYPGIMGIKHSTWVGIGPIWAARILCWNGMKGGGTPWFDSGPEPLEIPRARHPPVPPEPTLTARLTLTAAMHDHLLMVAHFARHAAAHLNLRTGSPTWLQPTLRRFRILKSPFVHGKSKEIFERRTHQLTVDVISGRWETQRVWADYVVKSAPAGVKVTLEEWTREELGYGKRLWDAANAELARRAGEEGRAKKVAWPPRTTGDVIKGKAEEMLKKIGRATAKKARKAVASEKNSNTEVSMRNEASRV